MSQEDPRGRWAARWYLWDGGFLTVGSGGGIVPPHAHHAVQVSIGIDREIGLLGPDGTWHRLRGGTVAPDVEHQLDGRGAFAALLFVDPETREGRWLRRSLEGEITAIPPARLRPAIEGLHTLWDAPLTAAETATLLHALVRGLCAGPPPARPLDPRIDRALEVIQQAESARISLDEVARAVFLSPSRLAHLFKEEVGLPFRRYLLWRRLTRAMIAVGRGSTLSAAAHRAGFADAAHLSRTSVQMFGLPPSVMLSAAEFYEIPAPFELARAG